MHTRARKAVELSQRQRRIIRARDAIRANLSLTPVSLAPSAGAFQGCRVLYQRRRRTHARTSISRRGTSLYYATWRQLVDEWGPCCSVRLYTIAVPTPPQQQLDYIIIINIACLCVCVCVAYPVGGGDRSCRSRHVLTAMLCFVLQGCRSFAAVCSILSGARSVARTPMRTRRKTCTA